LFWGCAGMATSFGVTALAAGLIHWFGTEEQKRRWLTFLCDPKQARLGAVCLTEPGAGSDFGAIRTRAIRRGDEWVINGRKCFITNGGIADLYLVFAKTKPEDGHNGVSLFLVPKDAPGIPGGKRSARRRSGPPLPAACTLKVAGLPPESRRARETGARSTASSGRTPAGP